MKEYVLVEFIADAEDSVLLAEKLKALGDEFVMIQSDIVEEIEVDVYEERLYVSGRISSAAASFIKLSDKFLSDRMRVSYIPEELKDKYRR